MSGYRTSRKRHRTFLAGRVARVAPATAGGVLLCAGLTAIWWPLGLVAAGVLLLLVDWLVIE